MQQNYETERKGQQIFQPNGEQHVCAAPGCTALCTGLYCRKHKPKHPMAVYLGRANGLKKEIRETKELLAQLREQSTRATSRLSATRLSGTGMHDAMAGNAIRIVEAEERLEKIIADWAEALAVRVTLLSMMEDPRERRLLELRYLHGLSIEDICVRLNMERMQVWRVQGSALEHFREVYERAAEGHEVQAQGVDVRDGAGKKE